MPSMPDLKEPTDQCMPLVFRFPSKVEEVCSRSLSTQLRDRVRCDATRHLCSELLFIEQVATVALELWTVAAGVCLQPQDLWKNPGGFHLDPLRFSQPLLPLPLFSCLLFYCRQQVGGSFSCS